MKQKVLIVHAKAEEEIAEQIANFLIEKGYDVAYEGTIIIGDSLLAESSKLLAERTPVVFCATFKAVATKWARQLVNAARNLPSVRIFALQMDEEVDMDLLTLGEKYGRYWENPNNAMNELKEALHKYYPVTGEVNSNNGFQTALNKYYDEIKKRYQRLDLDSLTPPERTEYLVVQLRSVYVEQNVRDNPPPVDFPREILKRLQENNEFEQDNLPEDIALEDVKRVSDVYFKKAPQPVMQILSDPVNQHTVILGDPGSGKSTLSRYIILSMIDSTQDSIIANSFPKYLPLLIELKSYIALIKRNSNCKNFIDYFGYLNETEGFFFENESLHNYLVTVGKAIITFDGLDEIFEPDERDQICRHIDKFKETYPQTRIIVTSRVIGFRRKILTDAGFKIYTLQDLDERQIKVFVEKWYSIALFDKPELAKERCNLIIEAVKDSPSIRQLAGNPMLLTIMAILTKSQELPRERWKLYDHATRVLIEIWDVNKYLKYLEDKDSDIKHIDEDDKREMLQKIAYKMQVGKNTAAGNYIFERELQSEFEKYIIDRYQESPRYARITAQQMTLQLSERNFILSLYGAKLYGFVHRAFLEYFCALYFLHDFKNTHRLTLEQLKRDVFGQYWQDQSWHEVLKLVTGMIEPEFAGAIISFLSDEIKPQFSEDSNKNLISAPLNLALAIKCISEVKKIHLLIEPAKKLLNSLCFAFDSDMVLPPIFFLFFKQHILPFARLIGDAWPDKDELASILSKRLGNTYAYIYDHAFGSFIGYVGKGSDKVHKAVLDYAYHDNPKLRVSAPFALAIGWKEDPGTFSLLCKLADNDPHRTVCYAAIYSLAENYNNLPETFEILKRNAEFSLHEFGRAAAITGLADHYHLQEGIFEFIKQRSRKEPSKFPRTVAIKALGEYFTYLEGTYELLLDAAKNDESPNQDDKEYADPYYVRDAALAAIFRHWPDHKETSTLLRDCLKNDVTPWLRQKAEAMLNKIASNRSIKE